MLVPLDFAVAVRDLDEPHARLGEPAGQQALPAEVGGDGVVQAIELSASRPSRRTMSSTFGHLRLHAEGQLERVDARLERRLRARLGQVVAVHRRQSIELQPLDFGRTARLLSM